MSEEVEKPELKESSLESNIEEAKSLLLAREREVFVTSVSTALDLLLQILNRNIGNTLTPELATGVYSMTQAELEKVLTETYDKHNNQTS